MKKMSELSNEEKVKLIQRISNVMKDEFDISPDEIDSFWEHLLFSVKYEKACKDAHEKALEGAC